MSRLRSAAVILFAAVLFPAPCHARNTPSSVRLFLDCDGKQRDLESTLIRGLLFLRLSEASDEEILPGSKNLPTGYNFSVWFGLNYRFGLIFNNVVNPRLDF